MSVCVSPRALRAPPVALFWVSLLPKNLESEAECMMALFLVNQRFDRVLAQLIVKMMPDIFAQSFEKNNHALSTTTLAAS